METTERWRVIDTGLQAPDRNAALDRAVLEAREADEIPSTLRFLRYTPSVLLGALQDSDPLLDEEACRASGVGLHRRLTGGGTFFCLGAHLAWALYLGHGDIDRRRPRTVLKRLCHAAAAAISALGTEASYRARNEIVVDGRVLAHAGVLYSDEAVLFQAVLALEGDVGERAALLRTPWRADEWAALLRARHTTLHEVLGRKADLQSLKRNLVEAYESEFGVEFRDADLTLSEHARYATAQREQAAGAARGIVPGIAIRIAVAEQEHGGARLAACVAFDDARIVRQVWFRGFVLSPAHALPDLEAALRNVAADGVEEAVRRFFSSHAVRCEGCAPAQFGLLVRRAVDQPLLAR